MADKIDLTFSELLAELPAGSITYDDPNDDIKISTKAITGDTYAALTDEGVIELLYKIRVACGKAQTTVNADLDPGDAPLTTFLPFVYNAPNAAGNVIVNQVQTVRIPLSDSTVKGTN